MLLVRQMEFESVALPLVGAGCGGGSEEMAQTAMLDELSTIGYEGTVYMVRFRACV